MRFQSTKISGPIVLRFPVRLAAKEHSIDQLLMGDAPKVSCRICQIANAAASVAKPVKSGKHNSSHILQKSVKFVRQFLKGKNHSTEKREETSVTYTTLTPQRTAVINKETSHRQEQVSKPKTKSTGKPSSKQIDPRKKKYSKMIKYYMNKDRIYQEQKKLKLGDKYVKPEPTATVELPDVLSMKEFALRLIERDEKRKLKAARRAMKEDEEMRRAHRRQVQERKRQIQDSLDMKKQIPPLDPQFEENKLSVFPATAPAPTTEEPVEQLPHETKEELLRRQQAAKMRGTNRAFMARAAYGRSAFKRPTFSGTAASFRAYGY